jgi:hypothetical protein
MGIREDLTLIAADGVPVAVPTFGMVFFTDHEFTTIAESVLYVFDHFLKLIPAEELRWYATENMSKHKATTKRTTGMLQTWLSPGAPPREYVMLELKNGSTYNAAGDIRCTVYGYERSSPGYEDGDSGSISIAFPVEWGELRTSEMLEIFVDWCTHFPFRSARAGYSFEWSRYAQMLSHPHIWSNSMRHPGIDVAWPSLEGQAVKRNAIRGIGWLTALCDEFVNQLGGREKLKAELYAPVQMIGVRGGLILKAGNSPAFGDLQANDPLPGYQQVYRAVAPLIDPVIERHPSFSLRQERYEKTATWLRRFAQ